MPDASTAAVPAREAVGSYIYLATVYAVAVGTLYVWGYWAEFDFNILEYFSVADIVRYTAFPLAATFAGGVLVTWYLDFLFGTQINATAESTAKYLAGKNERFSWFTSLVKTLFVVGLLAAFEFGGKYRWLIVAMLVTIPCASFVARRPPLSKLPESTRVNASYFLVLILFSAYGLGYKHAQELLMGSRFLYPVTAIEGLTYDKAAGIETYPRYVGHAGDHYFFYLPVSKGIAISPAAQVKTLQLQHFGHGAATLEAAGSSKQIAPLLQHAPASAASQASR